MEIDILNERKIVEIWITRTEQTDSALRADLHPICQQYKQQGYLVIIFSSGSQDLAEMASALLCYNCKHLAELQTKQEKQHSPGMHSHLKEQ